MKPWLTWTCVFRVWGVSALPASEAPPEASAPRLAKPPEIDGELDDPAWLEVSNHPGAVLSGWKIPASGDQPERLAPQQRIVYIAYDDDALYIALQAFVADLEQLYADGGGNPFLGDCLEVHLNVPNGSYFQCGIDFKGNVALGTAQPGTDVQSLRGETALGDNFWTAELAIPWKLLGMKPEKGARLGLALSANRAAQDGPPDSLTRLHWGRSFHARKTTANLKLE
jgi:hypothetical protein